MKHGRPSIPEEEIRALQDKGAPLAGDVRICR